METPAPQSYTVRKRTRQQSPDATKEVKSSEEESSPPDTELAIPDQEPEKGTREGAPADAPPFNPPKNGTHIIHSGSVRFDRSGNQQAENSSSGVVETRLEWTFETHYAVDALLPDHK